MRTSILSLLAISAVLSGCYTTRIYSPDGAAGPPPQWPQHEDHQWFLLAGAIDLSHPAGRECLNGLAYAESEMAGGDILIAIGLSIAGSLIGASTCNSDNLALYGSCISGLSSGLPLLISRRTVGYTCRPAHVGMTATPDAAPPQYLLAP